MSRIQYLTFVWILFITQTRFVRSEIQFLERKEGESVVLPCVIDEKQPPPYGVYLKRSWLQKNEVLFMYTKSEFHVNNSADKKRINVSGDPSNHSLEVTISQLRVSDTDRYFCEFIVDNPASADARIRGKTEFFLLVSNDTPLVDTELVKTCAGGSAVLPCLTHPSNWDSLTVDGVSLKRQRGKAPVEMLYHSKRLHGSSTRPSISQFSDESVQLLLTSGPDSISFNITLQQLQPEDSGQYSCQLLVRGQPDTITSLGRRVFIVSVEDCCSCSSYSTLLYIVFSAVVVIIVTIIIGFVMIHKGKARHHTNVHSQAPIYEEMTGVRALNQKVPRDHLEETESSEYRDSSVKKSCPENHYESPRGGLRPKT